MKKTDQLICSFCWDKQHIDVGEMVKRDKEIFFKYYPDFLNLNLNISPFKLPLSEEILQPDTLVFDGLFGIFDDSLPDGWGRLLLDRTLVSKGRNLNEVTPLDRLSIVGNNGSGALCYRPVSLATDQVLEDISLDQIANASQQILSGASSEMIEQLFLRGGSSGGARPKIFVGYHPEKDLLCPYQQRLPKDYEHWIIKFPANADPQDIAQIEYAYYLMATEAGLHMSDCHLFTGMSGRKYFGTKRFDRIGNRRLHLHSASGLMHDNFRLSSMDYGHLMDAAFRLENDVRAYEKVFRLAAFNIYANNRDDHSKNFAFLMNAHGEWQMAPAFDLTFSTSSHGQHSTTVAGEGKSPGKSQLLELAHLFGIDQAENIIRQVKEVTNEWKYFANQAGVTKNSTKWINDHLTALPD